VRLRKEPPPNRWIIPLAVIALLVVAGIGYLALRPAARKAPLAPSIRTAVVRKGTVQQTLRVSGAISAKKSAQLLAPRLPGRGPRVGYALILNTLAPSGARVRKGDVVAEFDTQYMVTRLDDSRAALVQHQATVRRMRAQLDVKRAAHTQLMLVAKSRWEKSLLDLKTAPVRSAIENERFRLIRDEARAHYDELVRQRELMEISELASIRRSELYLKESEMDVRRAQANVDRMTLRAPMDGLVVLQTIRRGSDTGQVQAGDQLSPGYPFLQIVDSDEAVLNAEVNQADAQDVRLGMRARVRIDAYPGAAFEARVMSVGGFARSGGRRGEFVRGIPVKLDIEGSDTRLLPDLSASADIILKESPESAVVPRACVFEEPDGAHVFVRKGSAWERRPVTVGDVNYVLAGIETGVQTGELVAAELPPVVTP
jgi:multidrug efflux pump subunit AcrA (membrane-fusion protein)